jgi:hypothetical protein
MFSTLCEQSSEHVGTNWGTGPTRLRRNFHISRGPAKPAPSDAYALRGI